MHSGKKESPEKFAWKDFHAVDRFPDWEPFVVYLYMNTHFKNLNKAPEVSGLKKLDFQFAMKKFFSGKGNFALGGLGGVNSWDLEKIIFLLSEN